MRTKHLTTWAPLAAVALLAACDLLPPSTPRTVDDATASASACTRCHGGDRDTSGAPPTDAHGARATTAIGVGAHSAHLGATLSAPVACEACHVVPRSADDGHVDGNARVSFGVRAFTDLFAGAQWRPAEATCTVYCHGATLEGGRARAPVWTKVDGTQAACDACHGAPPPDPHPAVAECGTCHDGYTATTVNVAKHLDGGIQVSAAGCTVCHGYPPAKRADGSPHATSTACSMCHAGTVNADGSLVANGLHRNGTVDTTDYHGAGWTLPTNHGLQANASLASCKGCHGADLTGGPVAVSCDTCHTAGWRTSCTFCHGDGQRGSNPAAPPQDTQNRMATTDRGVGAHQAHLQAGALAGAVACGECHAAVTTLDHVNGKVDVVFGAVATKYGAAPAWNGTTCTASYCHGQFTGGNAANAPIWTKVDGTQAACGTCHGIPPTTNHTTSTACGTCHDGYTPTSVNLATHINGTIEAKSPHAAGWADKAQHGYSVNRGGIASCKDCHGADLADCTACHAQSGFSGWATSCTFCHGDRAGNRASPPVDTQGGAARTNTSVGAHDKHVGTALMPAMACTECHPVRTQSVVTDAAHIDGDGVAEVTLGALAKTLGAPATYTRTSATAGSCANVYCHGKFTGGTAATVSWTSTTAMTCTSCHGAPPPAPHTTRTDCNGCHSGYTSTTVNAATHINGKVESTSPHAAGWADKAQHGYSANKSGFSSCKGCHGTDLADCTTCHAANSFPTWDTTCTFCHGNRTSGRQSPPVDTAGGSARTNTSVGAHDRHVAPAMMSAIGCAECHPARTASVVTDTAHVDGDGVAEVTFGTLSRTGGAAAAYTRTSATAATCSNVYCHGKFTGGTSATPSWVSTTAMTCSSCHPSSPSSGEHSRHVSRMACNICHNTVMNASGGIANAALHVNGAKNVAFGGTYNGRAVTGTFSGGSCSSLSCHGSQTW